MDQRTPYALIEPEQRETARLEAHGWTSPADGDPFVELATHVEHPVVFDRIVAMSAATGADLHCVRLAHLDLGDYMAFDMPIGLPLSNLVLDPLHGVLGHYLIGGSLVGPHETITARLILPRADLGERPLDPTGRVVLHLAGRRVELRPEDTVLPLGDALRGHRHFRLHFGKPVSGWPEWIEFKMPAAEGVTYPLAVLGYDLQLLVRRVESDLVSARTGKVVCTILDKPRRKGKGR